MFPLRKKTSMVTVRVILMARI